MSEKNPCNARCDNYECDLNAGGQCRAPNPCLGHEEAAKLIAELAEAKRELEKVKKVEDTLEAMNYLLACIVQELACICDGSDGAKQTAGMVVNEMLKIMSKREKEKKEGVAYAQHQ